MLGVGVRELSLFTGAGGGLTGSALLGWEPIGYVEWNEYCQKVIRQRIEDGAIPRAPIFSDVRLFASDGFAESYKGLVDVITAGFPCQPFSAAGKGAAENDERNMWPATINVIRAVNPRFCFLENVPNLLNHEYVRVIFRDLAESGYSCRWRCLSAAELGSPHKRNRLWIAAYKEMADPESESGDGAKNNRENSGTQISKPRDSCGAEDVASTVSIRQSRSWWAIDPSDSQKDSEGQASDAFDGSRWGIESRICRVANGVPNRLERLKAIGNGQVGPVAARAWCLLMGDL